MKALAIKYRPKTFDDVVEQGSIKQILQEQLRTNTHQNCYLFTGGAGTGKTTCARIFANEINGGKGNPIEIDAASNNGVDNVREIIENAKFKALDAPYKVYIIDECHMLSTGAWNAMLKLIEEPPAQTVFIFCTMTKEEVLQNLIRLGNQAKSWDNHEISNFCWAVLNRIKEEDLKDLEELKAVFETDAYGWYDQHTMFYSLAAWDYKNERLYIPVPLLTAPCAIEFARISTSEPRRNHYREINVPTTEGIENLKDKLKNTLLDLPWQYYNKASITNILENNYKEGYIESVYQEIMEFLDLPIIE